MLTDNHRRYVYNLLRHVEREITAAIVQLHGDDGGALFHEYRNFPSPERIDVLRTHLERLRAAMRRFMDGQHIDYHHDDLIEASWSFQTRLGLLRNALYDLRPGNLRGYGEISPEDEQACRALSAELVMLLNTMAGELDREPLRVPNGNDDALLATLVQIVERHRLFEYRSRVEALLGREQGDRVEVALLGRVSSGKSSLVNALLDHSLLPVGATPVTTVVTRIRYGERIEVLATDLDGRCETISPEDLRLYVDEAGNPGNRKRLREVDIRFPHPVLQQGIVLADTPGLGSLHTHASAHALDYLPRCDLGIVAIDVSATLMPQDLDIVRALRDASAEWLIVLTKADTVSAEALSQQRHYVTQALSEALQTSVSVSAVSVQAEHHSALDAWAHGVLRIAVDEAAAKAGARQQQRMIDLARLVQIALQQALKALPSASAKREGRHAAVLANLDDAYPRLHSLVRTLAERGPEVIVREMATETPAHRILRPDDVSGRAATLADAVVRDGLKTLRQAAEGMDAAAIAQVLRGAPPFAISTSDPWRLSSGWGPGWLRRPLLRRRLQQSCAQPLRESFEAYANILNHWLDQSVRELRRRAMESASDVPRYGGIDAAVVREDLNRLTALLGEAAIPVADARG